MLRLVKWLVLVVIAAGIVTWLWLERQGSESKGSAAQRPAADTGTRDLPAGKVQDNHSASDREALEKLIRDRLDREKDK